MNNIKQCNINFYKFAEMASRYSLNKNNKPVFVGDVSFPLYFSNEKILYEVFNVFNKREMKEGIYFEFTYFDVFLSKEVLETAESITLHNALPLYFKWNDIHSIIKRDIGIEEHKFSFMFNYLLMPNKVKGIFRIDGFETMAFQLKLDYNHRNIKILKRSLFNFPIDLDNEKQVFNYFKDIKNKSFFVSFFVIYYFYNELLDSLNATGDTL